MSIGLQIDKFLHSAKHGAPILDVRTPAEFVSGHIPGSVNLPLFDNRERVLVGTAYKMEGKTEAVKLGLQLVAPKLTGFIEKVEKLDRENGLLLLCWRGGMRSSSMAWLFSTIDIQCYTLIGGYKSYRSAAVKGMGIPFKLIVLGGKTGSGKTKVLKELRNRGEQVIDLEEIACHRGSSFGALGMSGQPTTEHFENLLFSELQKFDRDRRVWVEDESHTIGKVYLNHTFFEKMQQSDLICLEVPLEERVGYLVREYGRFDKMELKGAVQRIGKKLGGQHEKAALAALEEGDLPKVAETVLTYYDKAYSYGLGLRDKVYRIEAVGLNTGQIANELIELAEDGKLGS